MNVDIIILSESKSKRVTTTNHVDGCVLCVPDSQYKDYKKHNPNTKIVAHPDEVSQITLKRQWILDNFPNCFQIDDDLKRMVRLYTEKGEEIEVWKEEAFEIIQWTANVCKMMGSYLFGFNSSSNPSTYKEQNPFRLSGHIMKSGFGILEGSKLYFNNEKKLVDDYWIGGLNAYHHRKLFIDTRFGLSFKNKRKSGPAKERTIQAEKEETLWLRKKFGESIQIKKTKKKKEHPYERSLIVPF